MATFYIDLNGNELHSLELTRKKIKTLRNDTTNSDSLIKVKGPITLADLSVLFTHFPQMRKLDLSECSFTDKVFSNQANALPEHTSLREINLKGSNISIVHLEGLLHNTPNLKKLNITDCVLYGGFNPRNKLPSLETLTTREGHNPSVVRELKQKAPAVNLVHVSTFKPDILVTKPSLLQKTKKKVSAGKLFTFLAGQLMGPNFFSNETAQPLLKDFKKAKNKADFLLKKRLDMDFYRELNTLPKGQREKIVTRIIKERTQFDFDALIIKLSDLCFKAKGPAFIRSGQADFLADVLTELAKRTDKNSFAEAYKRSTSQDSNHNYPANYQLNDELKNAFSLIEAVAKYHKQKSRDDSYLDNLASNIANKLFNKLVLDSEAPNSPSLIKTAQNLQKAISDSQSMRQWFSERILKLTPENQEKLDHFFTKKEPTSTTGKSDQSSNSPSLENRF